MRLLLDQNLSAAVAASLRAHGIDAVHTSEVAMSTESDDVILEWCRQERRVAISRDTDFHAILAWTPNISICDQDSYRAFGGHGAHASDKNNNCC